MPRMCSAISCERIWCVCPRLIKPHAGSSTNAFACGCAARKYDQKQLKALSAITPGAAAGFSARTVPPADFFEQVEYSGRRLAKLNVPPAEIISALRIYDLVLDPLLKKLLPQEYTNFQWTREQLHFCVVLSLNNAFYQVREAETQAFYDLFRAELQAKNLDELLRPVSGEPDPDLPGAGGPAAAARHQIRLLAGQG